MASGANSSNVANVDEGLSWILSEAKSLLKTDEYASKTWMLVGKTLYPRCFSIRFEIYSLEKNSRKATETSLYLEELLATFYQEERVWEEVLVILRDVLKEEDAPSDEDVKFHRDVFHRLPRTLQSFVLREVSRRLNFMLPDIEQQSRLLLYVVNNYSDELPDQGVYLVDLWLAAEARDKEAAPLPVNRFREELVLKVLPKVLSSRDSISATQVVTWYIMALEYYVYLTAQDYTPLAGSSSNHGKDQPIKTDPTSKAIMPLDPWSKLRSLGLQVGKKVGWPERTELLFDPESSRMAKHRALEEAFTNLTTPSDWPEVELLKFFSLFLTLFFECLHGYVTCLDQQRSLKISAGPIKSSRALVEVSLLEDLDTVEDLRAKKPRLEEEPSAAKSSDCMATSEVVEVFLLAVKIWSTLKSGVFAMRLSALHNHWLAERTWPWMDQFNVDVMIYEGRYEEGLNLCESMKSAVQAGTNRKCKNRLLVQQICCAYRSCNRKGFVKLLRMWLFRKPDDLPLPPPPLGGQVRPIEIFERPCPYEFSAQRKEIRLRFVTLSDEDVLDYAARAVIGCLWGVWKCQPTSSHSDALIGHMMVLMQYNVYWNAQQLTKLLEHIKRQGRFSYNLFTTYIIDIRLLEEFMYLQSPEGGLVTLDILPTSGQNNASRTVTRGVNKDRREEMKAAIEKQVLRGREDVHQLLKVFLTKETDLLLREFI